MKSWSEKKMEDIDFVLSHTSEGLAGQEPVCLSQVVCTLSGAERNIRIDILLDRAVSSKSKSMNNIPKIVCKNHKH